MGDITQLKKLRDMTGAGVNAVRKALEDSNGDEEQALKLLRETGLAKADKRKDKVAANGVLGVYIHSNNRVVVVVEVNCETDFAAKSEDMQKFANALALQVAAANPKFISVDSVDQAALEEEMQTYKKELEGKPQEVQDMIMKGKLEKYYELNVLLNQQLFIDDSKTVQDYLNEVVAKIGEKIEIKSFSKFEVAQDILSCSINK